jgi:hypothetical protein
MIGFEGEKMIIESILRDRVEFFGEIRDKLRLFQKNSAMLASSLIFLALYGAVMGFSHSPEQAVSSMLKLPVLFIVTLLICTPSLYFFNLLFGSRLNLWQTIALVLTTQTTIAVLLLSFAPVTLFFLITSSDYTFFKLLNIGFFGISGAMGVLFFRQAMSISSENDKTAGVVSRRYVLLLWVLLYAFVGTQMAWTLSPFFGEPDKAFIVFRQIGGNFYSDVLSSIFSLIGFH